RELMRLYTQIGRRSEALRQFQRCSEAVRNRLDADPEEATIQLHRKILGREIQRLPQIDSALGIDRSIDTIAVLPFHNETGDPNLQYLSSDIAESVIKNLSNLPRIRVLSYRTVARYNRGAINPRRFDA
ncbi:MAG TPA: BTAD domain-containing putative transcriptional regulator, partial [Terriglobia bacterium]|nr:BTAD domain-containing putative transcriptional regulator [Terriglobia bacterium]